MKTFWWQCDRNNKVKDWFAETPKTSVGHQVTVLLPNVRKVASKHGGLVVKNPQTTIVWKFFLGGVCVCVLKVSLLHSRAIGSDEWSYFEKTMIAAVSIIGLNVSKLWRFLTKMWAKLNAKYCKFVCEVELVWTLPETGGAVWRFEWTMKWISFSLKCKRVCDLGDAQVGCTTIATRWVSLYDIFDFDNEEFSMLVCIKLAQGNCVLWFIHALGHWSFC